jgi:uncharacterized Tic20 family protein
MELVGKESVNLSLTQLVSSFVKLFVTTLISTIFCQTQNQLHNTRLANTCIKFYFDFILDRLEVNILLVSI